MTVLPKKSRKKTYVYLDHAAATPFDPRVIRAMDPYWIQNFGNPSALYSWGRKSNEAITTARKQIADILFTQPDCIIFTGSGTESNNMAIFGVLNNIKSQISKVTRLRSLELRRGEETKTKNSKTSTPHIITTVIEHHSVLEPIRELEKRGVAVTYIPVNQSGEISVENVVTAIRPETKLISIMYANNEIGTINPIAEIGRELLKYRQKNKTLFPYFHVDACQAPTTLELHTERLHVDLLSINGSKIYGPKGVGCLFIRRGVPLTPILLGGGQERGLRGGTENVPGIIGLAKALLLVQKNVTKQKIHEQKLRDYLWQEIKKKIPDAYLNGPELNGNRLANNLNVRFSGLETETLLLYLDAYGIIAATGSACTSKSNETSHVLHACGLRSDEAQSSIRFTLGKTTRKHDIDYVMKFLPDIVECVRDMKKVS